MPFTDVDVTMEAADVAFVVPEATVDVAFPPAPCVVVPPFPQPERTATDRTESLSNETHASFMFLRGLSSIINVSAREIAERA